MANLTVQKGTTTGIDTTTLVAAASGGDSFVNTGRELFIVKNADVSPHTPTFATPITVDGQAVADKATAVPAGHTVIFGPFSPSLYNDTGGNVNVTYDDVTSVTVTVVKVPQAS